MESASKIKSTLKNLQAIIPDSLLFEFQNSHSKLLYRIVFGIGRKSSICQQKPAVVFSPHQDDETFGCGGVIAIKRELGIPVSVVFMTDGRGSVNEETKNQIVQLRKLEAIRALEILGVDASEIYFLNQQDGTLPDLEGEGKQSFVSQLSEILKARQPGEVYVPHRKDCHRDHEAAYKLVRLAVLQADLSVDLFQYPIWLFWRAPLFIMLKLRDLVGAEFLSIATVQEKKQRAIDTYRSQLESLPSGFVNRFLGGYEFFFKESI